MSNKIFNFGAGLFEMNICMHCFYRVVQLAQKKCKRACWTILYWSLQNTIYYWQYVWGQTILKRHLTLIDVKFPKRPFESQKVAAVDGVTRSLRFVRLLFLPLQKYVVVTFEFLLPATWKIIIWRVNRRLKITEVIFWVDFYLLFHTFTLTVWKYEWFFNWKRTSKF